MNPVSAFLAGVVAGFIASLIGALLYRAWDRRQK